MKEFLANILVDPIQKKLLRYDEAAQELFDEAGHKYPVKEDVPQLLPPANAAAIPGDELHARFQTNFNYADHYQQDTLLFDYFKEDESAVTKFERNASRKAIIRRVPATARTILDVGCGGGWAAQHFLPKGNQVISMDISTTNPARVLKENPGERHAALTADAFFLPLKKDSIDCIIASEVMEHVTDPKKMLEGFLEVLKPGGRIILVTPYDQKIRYHLCVHCNRPTPENGHLHSFNEKNITGFLPAAGMNYSTEHFVNKYLLKLRLYNAFAFLPFAVWKLWDKLANKISGHARVFLICINKP